MLKKLASLLLSLLLCLSLLPGQANAADAPDPDTPPAQTEPAEQETPEEPGEPVMPLAEGMPDDEETSHR